MKDKVKTAHWVGQLLLRFLDTDYSFKRTNVVDYIEASVTDNTMKQSSSGGGGVHIYRKKKKNRKLKRLIMMLI